MTTFPSLSDLEFLPYLTHDGMLPLHVQGKVGVYAIFDEAKTLQCIGYSRDVFLSLQQHLVRQPDRCYWLKVHTIDRPQRAVLDEIRDRWITEHGTTPPGNGVDQASWHDPIDAKATMSAAEKAEWENALDDVARSKLLKAVARRVEEQILATLQSRGVQLSIRFNPKLKDSGLLDLK
jgi:hypothetical protein